MTRASESSPAARRRGLGLVSRANRWMATGAVVLTAAFSVAAAKEFHSTSSSSELRTRTRTRRPRPGRRTRARPRPRTSTRPRATTPRPPRASNRRRRTRARRPRRRRAGSSPEVRDRWRSRLRAPASTGSSPAAVAMVALILLTLTVALGVASVKRIERRGRAAVRDQRRAPQRVPVCGRVPRDPRRDGRAGHLRLDADRWTPSSRSAPPTARSGWDSARSRSTCSSR